jgi:hypothetical protein
MANASDNFNRANGNIGGTTASDGVSVWTTHVGTCQISSNRLNGNGTSARCSVDVGASDGDCTLTIATAGGSGSNRHGILFRYVDASNYLYVRGNGTAYELNKVVAGTTTLVVGSLSTVAAGDIIRINLSGSTIKIYRTPSGGGESLLTTQTVTDHQTATRFGYITAFSGDAVDDFSFVQASPGGNSRYYRQQQALAL